MSDLVERLRVGICYQQCRVKDAASGCECAEAADRIQQLETALEWIAGTALTEPKAMVEKARAALGEKP